MAGYSPLAVRYKGVTNFNEYPFFLVEYYYRMIRPPLFVNLFMLIYYMRQKELRQTMTREFKIWLNDLYILNA